MNADEKAEIQSRIENWDEPGAGLKDWTAIRVHLKKHDDEMIGDYEDDINTMLVFAGLFSAVVTAFIIDSYKWLQQDNTQVMIRLLMQISSQLPTPPPVPSFISTSSTTLGSDSANFRPSVSSVWINVLWLLSLLFSLTAALLGIIIKQWLREYLLWDSVLSPSREAVLLRHIRYAAWERWKVPAIISAIPAMLEFALVLFLCGSTILLWTLNVAVAIIITIFGGTFFILACLVNILPVFFHRCPYKSATGWGCLVAWQLARRWSSALFARLRLASRHDRRSRPPIRRQSASWRQRDLQRRSQWGTPIPPGMHPELDKDGHLETSEFVVLFQALAWVCTSTHDDRLLAKVRQCAANFPPTARKYACLVPGMHVVCQIFSLDAGKFFGALRSGFRHQQYPEALYGSYTLVHRRVDDIWQGHLPELAVLHMVGDVLRNVVQVCIDELFLNPAFFGAGHNFPQQAEMNSFVEALCLLIHIFPLQSAESQQHLVNVLVGLYNKLREALHASPWLAFGDIRGPRYPGFTATVFQFLCRIGTVNIDGMGQIHVDTFKPPAPGHYARLAVRVSEQNIHARREEQHLFVVIANDALVLSAGQAIDEDSLGDLFTRMEDTLQETAQHGVRNCGFYGDLPWIDTLLDHRAQPSPDIFNLVPPSLISALEASVASGMTTGSDLEHKLDMLKSPVTAARTNGNPTSPTTSSTRRSQKAKLSMSPAPLFDAKPMHEKIASSSSQSTFGMPSPYMPPTPFSWEPGDVELGVVPYAFPFPSAQTTNHQRSEHSRGSTWPS